MNLTFQLIDPAGGDPPPGPHPCAPGGVRRPHPFAAGHPGAGPPPGSLPHRPHPGGVVRVETAAAFCGGEVLRQAAFAFAVAREIRRERKVPVEGDGWPEAPPRPGQSPHRPGHPGLPLPRCSPARGQGGPPPLPGVAWALQKGGALPSEAALAPRHSRPWPRRPSARQPACWSGTSGPRP